MGETLKSWQEIATYVGKGLRTVQRWEREIDFPVHRVGDSSRAVMASTDEINEWMRRSQAPAEQKPMIHLMDKERHAQMMRLRDQVNRLCEQTSILCARVADIKARQRARGIKDEELAVMEVGKS